MSKVFEGVMSNGIGVTGPVERIIITFYNNLFSLVTKVVRNSDDIIEVFFGENENSLSISYCISKKQTLGLIPSIGNLFRIASVDITEEKNYKDKYNAYVKSKKRLAGLDLLFSYDTIVKESLENGWTIPSIQDLVEWKSSNYDFKHELVWVSDDVPLTDPAYDDCLDIVKLGYCFNTKTGEALVVNKSHKHNVVVYKDVK